MEAPRYIGDTHPEEYIKEMRAYCSFKKITDESVVVKYSKMMVDSTIDIPSDIESCEDLVKALKEHISFPIFTNSCKRKLHLLKYRSEREGGDTPKFIANFRALCRDAEIEDIETQKNILYYTLPNDFFRNSFIKQYDDIKSMTDLIVRFENTLNSYSKFILNGTIVALKHVKTGKYLCSNNYSYGTGSKNQAVFCNQFLRDSNSTWLIKCFNSSELLAYESVIYLQHCNTKKYLEICSDRHNKSPVSNKTEVSCGADNNYSDYTWILDRNSSTGSKETYLKTQDIIVLKNEYSDYLTNQKKTVYLGSHDVLFNLEKESFQEIFAQEGEVSEHDEWRIELIE